MGTAQFYAQKSYEVTPGTNDNKIALIIANKSKSLAAEKITAALMKEPKGIEIKKRLVELLNLAPQEEREILFEFDTKRIPETDNDTLKFLISGSIGTAFIKEIVLTYSIPKELKLEQNYPNPFNPITTIEYVIPEKGNYRIQVFNLLGQLTQTLCDNIHNAGYYKLNFDGKSLTSGIYFYRLSGNNVNLSKKMILMK